MDASHPRRIARHVDYAIVTRLAGNNDEPPLMSVAGLGGFGTQGAARLVADPAAIAALVSELPKDSEKNLQIVISLKISDFKIVSREVVATRVW
jgi:malonyl CoA-acyl carrier protein transacylase